MQQQTFLALGCQFFSALSVLRIIICSSMNWLGVGSSYFPELSIGPDWSLWWSIFGLVYVLVIIPMSCFGLVNVFAHGFLSWWFPPLSCLHWCLFSLLCDCLSLPHCFHLWTVCPGCVNRYVSPIVWWPFICFSSHANSVCIWVHPLLLSFCFVCFSYELWVFNLCCLI